MSLEEKRGRHRETGSNSLAVQNSSRVEAESLGGKGLTMVPTAMRARVMDSVHSTSCIKNLLLWGGSPAHVMALWMQD